MTPGIHRLTMAEYLADPCPVPSLSSGCAFRLLSESPMHAWHSHPRLGGRPSSMSPAADTGTTAHDLLLGGDGKICEINPADYPSKEGAVPVGWTNNAIRAARDAARSNGLTPMLASELVSVRGMVRAARAFVADSEIAGVFDLGESELTVISQEGDTWLRTRPDWLNLDMGISLSFKTTKAKVHPEAFSRMADSMGYWFALAFYERALLSVLEADVAWRLQKPWKLRHIILAQEQTYPYACALFEPSPAKAAIERSQVDRAIRLWAKCIAEKKWPAYGPRIHHVEPKPWDLAAEEARLQAEELEAMEA
jgi:hypothetical protein